MLDFNDCYKGKNVLVTGHTGFKGSWLSIWLKQLGANVIGYSLDPSTNKDNFVLSRLTSKMIDVRGDIRDYKRLEEVFEKYEPEIVFHLAAQPLVRASYEKPIETYETNIMGTLNILECIRKTDQTKIGIMITTDKCYENKEQLVGYKESDPMGGYDPYSSSKGCAELAISSWLRSFFNPKQYQVHGKSIASVRAGNVIGGGDWALDRIIPDCIRDLELNRAIRIRNPKAIRPWQHVLEPLSGYLRLGQKMFEEPIKYCEGWNFGPNEDSIISVWDVAMKVVERYGKGEIKDESGIEQPHEAKLLMLNIDKVRSRLGWIPKLNINETLDFTIEWYKEYRSSDIYQLCVDQINKFSRK
ncbi:CDP-glucose 4,6-dehydratase [Alkalihalobacillus deserti]|uniref:CDP-glucose 4,6-dehydratase n=1 Tax=Alkalihalobacillus deserti TaxID=2879466 RepID=UPI001D133499|nr:CDP-glucose 4,6-dehydratase [Alkalihalobacillus deserti]